MVKIVTTGTASKARVSGHTPELIQSITRNLRDTLAKEGVPLSAANSGSPLAGTGVARWLMNAIRPRVTLTPRQTLEMEMLKLAHRFEDRRVLVVIAGETELGEMLTPNLYEEAGKLDIEVLILSLRACASGTAATLKQRGFGIEIWDVTAISAPDIAGLLSRGILGRQN